MDRVTAYPASPATAYSVADPYSIVRFFMQNRPGEPNARIRGWWEDVDAVEYVVFDNGFNQAIGGGSIVVHTE